MTDSQTQRDNNLSSTPVAYRLATEDDIPALAAQYDKLDRFLREFSYGFPEVEDVGEKWLDIFRRTMGRFSIVYVAERGNGHGTPEMMGFILARLKRVPEYLGGVMVGELKDMWVDPEVRRLGVGEELLRLAIEWCWSQDVHSVEAQILRGNEPITQLVEYLGMKSELYQMRMMPDEYNRRKGNS